MLSIEAKADIVAPWHIQPRSEYTRTTKWQVTLSNKTTPSTLAVMHACMYLYLLGVWHVLGYVGTYYWHRQAGNWAKNCRQTTMTVGQLMLRYTAELTAGEK